MILTEEEAKTKRCHEGYGQPLYNSQIVNPPTCVVHELRAAMAGGVAVMASPSHCIGSACMAWRWYGMKVNADGSIYNTTEAYRVASGLEQMPEKYKEAAVAVGYCGKAGKP